MEGITRWAGAGVRPSERQAPRAVELIREAVPQESAAPRTSALSMAVQNRTPAAGDGDPWPTTSVQTGSRAFIQRAGESGLVPSRGSIAGCCGNGPMEHSGSRVPVELLDRHRWRARLERANAISDHLGSRRRRHCALGRVSPVACERAHTTLAQRSRTGTPRNGTPRNQWHPGPADGGRSTARPPALVRLRADRGGHHARGCRRPHGSAGSRSSSGLRADSGEVPRRRPGLMPRISGS